MKDKSNIKQIFLSHEKNDENINELAKALSKELQSRGYKVWSDKYIMPGDEWITEVKEALNNSDAMVALLDQYSFSSSYVRNEIEHAFFDDNYKNRLLPVLIRESNFEKFSQLPWYLKNLNYIEISKKQTINKSVAKIANHFQNLVTRKEDNNA